MQEVHKTSLPQSFPDLWMVKNKTWGLFIWRDASVITVTHTHVVLFVTIDYVLYRLRARQVLLLEVLSASEVVSAIFFGAMCWGSSIWTADRKTLVRRIRRASSVLGFPLDPVEVEGQGTVRVKKSHPLQDTPTATDRVPQHVSRYRRSFLSNFHPKYLTYSTEWLSFSICAIIKSFMSNNIKYYVYIVCVIFYFFNFLVFIILLLICLFLQSSLLLWIPHSATNKGLSYPIVLYCIVLYRTISHLIVLYLIASTTRTLALNTCNHCVLLQECYKYNEMSELRNITTFYSFLLFCKTMVSEYSNMLSSGFVLLLLI